MNLRSMLLTCAIVCGLLLVLAPPDSEAAEKLTVTLTVDYGDGVVKKFTRLPYKDGMTVLDTLKAAKEHKRGIRFDYSGSGSTAFLTSIDGKANEGGGGDNWVFRVNGNLGDKSFGIYKLVANDDVNWTFGTYKP